MISFALSHHTSSLHHGITDYGSDEDQDSGDEDGEDDDLIEIENSFYEGDDYIKEDPNRAVKLFEKVVELETAR